MESFDARSSYPELEVQKDSGSVIFTIHPISKKGMDEVNAEKAALAKAGSDVEKQFLHILNMVGILCPDATEEDIIDIPYEKIIGMIGKMMSMAVGYSVPEEQKKTTAPKKMRSSRSRRRASA